MELHGAVVELHHSQGNDEDKGQQGVEIIGNGPDKQLNAADAGIQIGGHAGDGGGPGGYRSDHAHGGGGSVNEVGQLGPGNLVSVGDGTHDTAHGEAVEVVVNEDQHTQDKGGQHGPYPSLDVLLRPAAEGGGTAGGVHQSYDDAQEDQEEEDAGIALNGGDQAVVDDGIQDSHWGEVALEQGAYQDADEQGRVGLLGDEGQDNGHDGGHQAPEGRVHVGEGGLAVRGESYRRQGQADGSR